MKSVFYVPFVLLLSVVALAQRKTYSGEYEGGIATYTYYENSNFERMFEGPFKYKASNIYREGRGRCTIDVSGQYKANQKDGLWIHKVSNPDIDGTTETASGSYVDGKFHGKWQLKNINNKTKKVVRESYVQFDQGKLIGKFKYNYSADFAFQAYSQISVVGRFDNSGLYDSTWMINYKSDRNQKNEEVRKYKNGKLFFRLHRNSVTGKILDKYDTINGATDNQDTYEGYGRLSLDRAELPDEAVKVWLENGSSSDDNFFHSIGIFLLFNRGEKNDNSQLPPPKSKDYLK